MAGENKHASRSAQTRLNFIQTALKLYAERGIDAVSLNEITVAAGQKNRNALQYHFGDRNGLLQAIIDTHANNVSRLRGVYAAQAAEALWTPAEASARVLIMPLADYAKSSPEGVYYLRLLSQRAIVKNNITNPGTHSPLSFRREPELRRLMRQAMAHLKPAEAQRRMFLIVSMAFHSLAEACRVVETQLGARGLKNRQAMFEQVVCSIEAFIAAPARDK